MEKSHCGEVKSRRARRNTCERRFTEFGIHSVNGICMTQRTLSRVAQPYHLISRFSPLVKAFSA